MKLNTFLLLATNTGLVICKRVAESWRELRRGLTGQRVTSVIAREGVILAGTRKGVFRSDNEGASWREASAGLGVPYVRWLAYHPDISDFEFAGTEPAGIFVSRDGAGSWRECTEVTEMRRQYGWSLPYSPEAGCVRGFAIHGRRAYAAVEDGCVLVSEDGGESWRLAPGSRGSADHRPRSSFIHSDVHSIEVHPTSGDLVYAPTGGGFYRSQDGGRSWKCIYPHCYCRAVWIDPADPNHILLGPADGVDYNGRIERTVDGGASWLQASEGLSVPWRRHMVERFTSTGGELLAVLSNGELFSAQIDPLKWVRILPEIERVEAAAVMER
jgi:photosystem II stability/assembly factor-like uncharacterized protein